MDSETGRSAFELRNYNSTIGRWLSPDPYAQHWSPYLAMSNNPISFIDPDGGQDDPYSQEWHDGSNMWWAHVGPTSRIYEEFGVDGISFSRHSLTGNNGTVYSSWDKGTIQKIETALYMYALTGTFHRIATFKKLDGTDEEGKYTGNSYKLGGEASQVATGSAILDKSKFNEFISGTKTGFNNNFGAIADQFEYATNNPLQAIKDGIRDNWQNSIGPIAAWNASGLKFAIDGVETHNENYGRIVLESDIGRIPNLDLDDFKGPILIALGKRIESLKPVGALGSQKGSSIASYYLSKWFPGELDTKKFFGKKVRNLTGTKVVGTAAGRFVPGLGWVLTIYDVGQLANERTEKIIENKFGGDRGAYMNSIIGVPKIQDLYLCFVAGTEILIDIDGSTMPIENLSLETPVVSYNLNRNLLESDEIVQLDSTVQHNFVEIKFANGKTNLNTPVHPYFVKGKGWSSVNSETTARLYHLNVSKLNEGDVCYYYNGIDIEEVEIISIEVKYMKNGLKTYNVSQVKKNNNFFANGFLVHNKLVNEIQTEKLEKIRNEDEKK